MNSIHWSLTLIFALTSLSMQSQSTISIINSNDGGSGSLRQAVLDALPGDTIRFSSAINGDTISLTTGQIMLDDDIVIIGNQPNNTIIDGSNLNRIFLVPSSTTIKIYNLALTGGNAFEGGAISNRGNLVLTDCIVANNNASNSGGGIYNIDGYLNLYNTIVSQNSTSSRGGGIVNVAGEVVLNNSSISENSSISGGALHNSAQGNVTMINTFMLGNSAEDGGGIFNLFGSELHLINSTLSGNSASEVGGGIINVVAFAEYKNTTISGNSASERGGGVANISGTDSYTNSIVALNVASDGVDIFTSGNTTDGGHNLIGNGSDQSALIDGVNGNIVGTSGLPIDPIFITDVDITTLPNTSGNLGLQCTSPGINAGTPDTTGLNLEGIDILGNPRVINNTIDIGAFEQDCPEAILAESIPTLGEWALIFLTLVLLIIGTVKMRYSNYRTRILFPNSELDNS